MIEANLAKIVGIFVSFSSILYADKWARAQYDAQGIFWAPLNSTLISKIVLALNSALTHALFFTHVKSINFG